MASLRDALIQSVETPDCTAFSLGLLRCSLFEADWSLWGCLLGVVSLGWSPWDCLLGAVSLGWSLCRGRDARVPVGLHPWVFLLGVGFLGLPPWSFLFWGWLLGSSSLVFPLGFPPWVGRFAAGGTPAYQSVCTLGLSFLGLAPWSFLFGFPPWSWLLGSSSLVFPLGFSPWVVALPRAGRPRTSRVATLG